MKRRKKVDQKRKAGVEEDRRKSIYMPSEWGVADPELARPGSTFVSHKQPGSH